MAKTNHLRRSVPRLITPIALAIVLAACSSTPSEPQNIDITQSPTLSLQEYMLKADTSQGSLQNDWLIMALKSAISSNELGKANLLLSRLTRNPLSPPQQAEWQLAQADILLKRNQYIIALQQLRFDSNWQLPTTQWLRYYQTRATIFSTLERWMDTNRALIEMSRLSGESDRALLSESIWQNLNKYSLSDLQQSSVSPKSEPILFGWIQLAGYVKNLNGDFYQLKELVQQWMNTHPTHPATLYPPESVQALLKMEMTKPQHTALLLPLSGKFAKQAHIIRDGFMFSMVNDKTRNPNATLQVIDTQSQPLESTLQQITQSNIDFVVGPLIKENIVQMKEAMQSQERPIPMLALNIPDVIDDSPNTCYFTLSPEQEASETAKYLASQGYQYPMILAQSGHYGKRVVEAFKQEWALLSDHPVTVSYLESKQKMQREINTILGLQESQQNIAQMQSILDIPLESQPRSRRDTDAIFIIAGSSDLTLIKPFIEVAINPEAKKPQLFASSRSNASSEQYEDLGGMLFSDIPLLVSAQEELKQQIRAIWPDSSNAEMRLRALGMDAYTLVNELPQMKAVEGYEVQGQTGQLSIDGRCVVQRKMNWAERVPQE